MSESNIAELTDALTTVRAQADKLVTFASDLKEWKIEWTVEIQPSDLSIVVTAMKPFGGGGVRKTISKDDAMYYVSDPATLVKEIAEEVYVAILRDVVQKELGEKLPRALNTVARLNK